MSDIINLRAVRKAKERQADRAQADANAIKYGRRKTDKALETARAQKEKRDLDGHERE